MMNRRLLRKEGSANKVAPKTTVCVGRVRSTQRGSQTARPGLSLGRHHTDVDTFTHDEQIISPKNKVVRNNTKHKHRPINNSLTHGDKLNDKRDGYTRIAFENWNGLAPWKIRNDKIILARKFIRQIKADAYAGAESRAQWDLLKHKCQLQQLFQTEVSTKAITAHNVHEDDSRSQEGGTGMVVFDQFASLIHSTGIDRTGLGRWCWMLVKGKHNHSTRIITAYQPCRSSHTRLHTVYNQHRRYYRSRGDHRCPRQIFRESLIKQITYWLSRGERILLFIDANENLDNGPLIHQLRKLHLRDLIRESTNTKGPPTHQTGRQ